MTLELSDEKDNQPDISCSVITFLYFTIIFLNMKTYINNVRIY